MDTKLKGKTALITGGSTGIGLGIAQVLADEGVDVAVASRNPEPAAVEDLKSRGVRVVAIPVDLTKEENVLEMFDTAIKGLGHLDFYINNSAVAIHQPVTRITSEAWVKTVTTNLFACLYGVREASKHIVSRGTGNILIVGSTSMYTPGLTETCYRTTKMGLRAIMQTAAIELGPHGRRVNLLVPGHYRTRLTSNIPHEIEEKLKLEIPLRRFGQCVECGYAAAFLLSDHLAGYINGAELVVDGGLYLRPLHFMTQEDYLGLNK